MNLSFMASILDSTYTDKLVVSRLAKEDNPDGTTGISNTPTIAYNDVPCRISFEQEDNSISNKEDTNPKNSRMKIFCSTNLNIKKGDKLIAKRMDGSGAILITYNGLAGLPNKFVSHQEIIVIQVGDA